MTKEIDGRLHAGLHSLYGLDVVVVPTVRGRRVLTWRERLLSWPWRPWIATTEFVELCPIADDEYVIYGRSVFVSQVGEAALIEMLRRRS